MGGARAEAVERRSQPGARKSRSGKAGEEQQAAQAGLDLLRVLGWLVLHDVAVVGEPEVAADHVVVGPSGVYVVNNAPWPGAVTFRDGRMIVGGTPQTSELDRVASVADRLRELLGSHPAAGVLCLVHGEPVAGVAGEVAVCSTENILDLLTQLPAVFDAATQQQVARVVGAAMTAAGPRRGVAEAPDDPSVPARHRSKGRRRLRRTAEELALAESPPGVPVAPPPPPAPTVAPTVAPPVAPSVVEAPPVPEPPRVVRAPAAPVAPVAPLAPVTLRAPVDEERAREAEERARLAEERVRAAEERDRQAAEERERRAAEEKTAADAAAQAAEQAAAQAEAERRAEHERQHRAAEEQVEAQRRKSAEELERVAAERARVAEDRRQAEEAQARAVAERKRAIEERRQAEEAQVRAEREARRAARERLAAEKAAAKRIAADRAAAARIQAAREAEAAVKTASRPEPVAAAVLATPVAPRKQTSVRALVPALISAVVVVMVVSVIPRVPDAVAWGKGLFGNGPDPALGTTVALEASTLHPALRLTAAVPVATRPTSGTVPAGTHLVAVALTLQNDGTTRWSLPLSSRVVVVDSLGIAHRPTRVGGVRAGKLLPATVNLAGQRQASGVVAFTLANGREVGQVRLLLSEDGEESVTWAAAP